jgi:hypothetical protein
MASHFGAHVIGTTSTLEKADLAKKNGAEVVVVGGDADALQKEVDRLTGGLGVHGALSLPDWERALHESNLAPISYLRRRRQGDVGGQLVPAPSSGHDGHLYVCLTLIGPCWLFVATDREPLLRLTVGNASGPVPEILPAKLAKGNWKLTRPTCVLPRPGHTARRQILTAAMPSSVAVLTTRSSRAKNGRATPRRCLTSSMPASFGCVGPTLAIDCALREPLTARPHAPSSAAHLRDVSVHGRRTSGRAQGADRPPDGRQARH